MVFRVIIKCRRKVNWHSNEYNNLVNVQQPICYLNLCFRFSYTHIVYFIARKLDCTVPKDLDSCQVDDRDICSRWPIPCIPFSCSDLNFPANCHLISYKSFSFGTDTCHFDSRCLGTVNGYKFYKSI